MIIISYIAVLKNNSVTTPYLSHDFKKKNSETKLYCPIEIDFSITGYDSIGLS